MTNNNPRECNKPFMLNHKQKNLGLVAFVYSFSLKLIMILLCFFSNFTGTTCSTSNRCMVNTQRRFLHKVPVTTLSKHRRPTTLTSASVLQSVVAQVPVGFLPSAFTFTKQNSLHRGYYHRYLYSRTTKDIIKNNGIRIPNTTSSKSSIILQNSRLIHNNNDDEIINLMRDAYDDNETDGILQIASKIKSMDCTGDELIIKALEAVNYNKGQTAAILNALIASCRCKYQKGTTTTTTTTTTIETSELNEVVIEPDPELGWGIYTAWEDRMEEFGLYPDIVTFCSTYSVMQDGVQLNDSNKDYYNECASQVLERAERNSKKIAGSKRRRLLASLSRRKVENKNVRAMECLERLKDLYGQDFDVLFENDDVVVVSKPSGMVCFHSHKTTDGKIRKKNKKKESRKNKKHKDGGNVDDDDEYVNDEFNSDISLEDALLDIGVQLSTLNPDAMGIVHRIDRGTSGVLVLAKNNESHAKLVTNFFTRSIDKSYLALVPFCACVTTEADENIRTSLDQSGIINHEISGKPALSTYNIIETYGSNAIQLELQTKTGRKHQVRVHCAKGLNRPIFLDPIYGAVTSNTGVNQLDQLDSSGNVEEVTKQIAAIMPAHPDGHYFFLHASSLKMNEFGIDVVSELPFWWKSVLSELKTMT